MNSDSDTVKLGPISIQKAQQRDKNWLNNFWESSSHSTRHIHFVNAHVLAELSKSKILLNIYTDNSAKCFLDSRPIEIALRIIAKNRAPRQFRGIDFLRCHIFSERVSGLHYFLGSKDSVLMRFSKLFSNYIKIAGWESPPYLEWHQMNQNEIYERIRNSGAQFVWVSLGTPKQDIAAYEIHRDLGVSTIAIGAAIDFITLEKKEAPILLRKIGLEWIFRLLTEPKRLWKRYLIGNLFAISYLIRLLRKNFIQ